MDTRKNREEGKMETMNKKYDIERTYSNLLAGKKCSFINENNRAFLCLKLKNAGIIAKKSISKNQNRHPEYIEDYSGEIEPGVGNSMYQTYFSKLYNLVVV